MQAARADRERGRLAFGLLFARGPLRRRVATAYPLSPKRNERPHAIAR